MDCGCVIQKGEDYSTTWKHKQRYVYCLKCKTQNHTRAGNDPLILLKLLETGPKFQDELLKSVKSTIIGQYYRRLWRAGIEIHKFRYTIRVHSTKTKKANFIIFYLEGQERKVIDRIWQRFGDRFTRTHFRDMLIPIIGSKSIRHKRGTSKKEVVYGE